MVIDAQGKEVATSIDIAPGASGLLSFRPNGTGLFSYHCEYHPDTMKGTITLTWQRGCNSRYPNFDRAFKIAVTYNDDDKMLSNHTEGQDRFPDSYLLAMEEQLKPSYQLYDVGAKFLHSENLYGFPTVSNTVDYTNYLGEAGRTKNVLAIVNGKGSFLLSYSNSLEAYNGYLPTVNQIIKSIVILK